MLNLRVSPVDTGLSFSPSTLFAAQPFAVPEGVELDRVVILDDRTAPVPYYSRDRLGVMRSADGMPQTHPGTITPIGFVDLHEDAPAVVNAMFVACGLAAAAWAKAGGGATTADRDAVLFLVEEACPISDMNLAEAFAIAEHELQPARDRTMRRLATDLEFTRRFAEARATMNAGCALFPWYQGDGAIPG